MSSRPTFIIESTSAEQTLAIGAAVGRVAREGDVVALIGELGAGKTQFVRGMAAGMGIDPAAVSSPTFVLMQEYEGGRRQKERPFSGRRAAAPVQEQQTENARVLVHIDAYRLAPPDSWKVKQHDVDLSAIGWEGDGHEIRSGAVVAVEWADLVRPALGEDVLEVTLTHEGDGRRVEIVAGGDWAQRLQGLGVTG